MASEVMMKRDMKKEQHILNDLFKLLVLNIPACKVTGFKMIL